MCQTAKFPILRERLNILLVNSGKTIIGFSKFLNISRQSLGYYLNGARIPDAKTIQQICTKCDVSSDWLLGLSDTPNPSITMQALCEITGFSESALKNGIDDLNFRNLMPILNCILENKDTSKYFCDALLHILMEYEERLMKAENDCHDDTLLNFSSYRVFVNMEKIVDQICSDSERMNAILNERNKREEFLAKIVHNYSPEVKRNGKP